MINNEITQLETDMTKWKDILNVEGIWLFLATLGTWSVSVLWLKIFALILIVYYFFERVTSQIDNRSSFPKRIKDLENRINNEISDETQRKAFLYDLLQLETSNKKISNVKYFMPYILSFIFWILSFFLFLK